MVRLATLDDIDSIKKIADKHTKEIGFVLRPALVEHCNKKTLLVYEIDGEIIGFCNYHHRRDDIPKPIRLKCPVDNESNKFYIHIGARLIETVAGKKRDLNVYEIGDIYSIGLLK